MIRERNYRVVLLLCILISICIGIVVLERQGRASSRTEWEYKVVVTSVGRGDNAENILNKFGSEGWELVLMNASPGMDGTSGTYFLKRAK